MNSGRQNDSDWSETSIQLLKDPDNVNLWQHLVQRAENRHGHLVNKTLPDDQIAVVRRTYELFLRKNPTILSYWTAYALWEFKLGNMKKADEIFQRGLDHGQYDVLYWVSLLKFKLDTISGNVTDVLTLFEDARQKIGFQYHSSEFYKLFMSFLQSYSDDTNDFKRKYVILMRSLWDIPLYDYSYAFKQIFTLLSSGDLEISTFADLIGEENLADLKRQTQNSMKLMSKRVRDIASDAYVVAQFRSYQLFVFEKRITVSGSALTEEGRQAWHSYLNFVETAFAHKFVVQLYERCLLATADHVEFFTKYADYNMRVGKYNSARQIFRRCSLFCGATPSCATFLRLVDLEIFTGHIHRARTMVSEFIKYNKQVPITVYQKLLQLEACSSPSEHDYLVSLASELWSQSHSLIILDTVTKLPIPEEKLRSFFALLLDESSKSKQSRVGQTTNFKDSNVFLERYSRYIS